MSKRFKTGLVVGKFCPPHKGHMYLIEQAARQCHRLDVFVYSNPDLPAMPSWKRSNLLSDALREKHHGSFVIPRVHDCDVHVWAFYSNEGAPSNRAPAWRHHEFLLKKYQYYRYPEKHPDAVFAAEDYTTPFAQAMHAVPVQFSRINGINATAIRKNPYSYPEITWMPRTVHQFYNENYPEKVAFMGAESTGKTTTAMACAEKMQGAYIPEVGARVFTEAGGELPNEYDWEYIVRQQRRLEDEAVENNIKYRYVFSDTEALTTKFFMYWMLGHSNEYVDKIAEESKNRYKHWFLCDDGIPFDGSNMRGPEEIRKVHQGTIRMMMDERGIDYDILEGSTARRLAKVRSVLEARRHRDWVYLG